MKTPLIEQLIAMLPKESPKVPKMTDVPQLFSDSDWGLRQGYDEARADIIALLP